MRVEKPAAALRSRSPDRSKDKICLYMFRTFSDFGYSSSFAVAMPPTVSGPTYLTSKVLQLDPARFHQSRERHKSPDPIDSCPDRTPSPGRAWAGTAESCPAEEHKLGLGLQALEIAAGLLNLGHHLDLFSGAAVINCAGLNVVDFIDDFFVQIPLELGLSGAEIGDVASIFFSTLVQRVGRVLAQSSAGKA